MMFGFSKPQFNSALAAAEYLKEQRRQANAKEAEKLASLAREKARDEKTEEQISLIKQSIAQSNKYEQESIRLSRIAIFLSVIAIIVAIFK